MTVVTIRPDSVSSWNQVGYHTTTVVTDNTDSTAESFLNAPLPSIVYGLENPSIPAGAIVASVKIRVRWKRYSTGISDPTTAIIYNNSGAQIAQNITTITWDSYTTTDACSYTNLGTYSPSDLNGFTIGLIGSAT